MLCRLRTGLASERDAVGNGVTAQTVASVNAAGAFAASVKTGNDFAIRAHGLRVDVDADAAHGVMNRRYLAACIPRSLGQLPVGGIVCFEAERILGCAGNDLVVTVDGCLQLRGVHLRLLCQVFNGFAFHDMAERQHVLDGRAVRVGLGLRGVANLVDNDPVRRFRLCEDGFAQGVTFGAFVDESLPALVDEDAVAS